MKKLLCFGDSNTWGCSPFDSTRYDEKTRWPMVMGSILGEAYTIIENGLNGRTVLNLSPVDKMANGIESIADVISNYIPLDIAIISLGLNDVFIAEDSTPDQISGGVEEIIDIIRNTHRSKGFKEPEIILVSPNSFNLEVEGSAFFELQINKLKCLPDAYSRLSARKKAHFFNASDYVTGSNIDGSHLLAEGHILLGKKLAEFILREIK